VATFSARLGAAVGLDLEAVGLDFRAVARFVAGRPRFAAALVVFLRAGGRDLDALLDLALRALLVLPRALVRPPELGLEVVEVRLRAGRPARFLAIAV